MTTEMLAILSIMCSVSVALLILAACFFNFKIKTMLDNHWQDHAAIDSHIQAVIDVRFEQWRALQEQRNAQRTTNLSAMQMAAAERNRVALNVAAGLPLDAAQRQYTDWWTKTVEEPLAKERELKMLHQNFDILNKRFRRQTELTEFLWLLMEQAEKEMEASIAGQGTDIKNRMVEIMRRRKEAGYRKNNNDHDVLVYPDVDKIGAMKG